MNQQGSALLERPVTVLHQKAALDEPPTRNELLDLAILLIERRDQALCFKATREPLDEMPEPLLRAMMPDMVDATVFEPLETVLDMVGHSTDGTFGGLMDSRLRLTRVELHNAGCCCLGENVTAVELIRRLRELKYQH